MLGTWVQPLVWEDFTCHGAPKPVRHNHWGLHALEPECCDCWSFSACSPCSAPEAQAPQLEQPLLNTAEKAHAQHQRPRAVKNNWLIIKKKRCRQACIPLQRLWFLLFSCPVVSDSATPWTAAGQASPSLTVSQSLPKFMSIALVMPSNHFIPCHPLLLLPSIFPSIRVFSSEKALCIRWPKYWSVSFSISPSNEYSGLISFKINWFDLLAVQETLKSLLQHHSSKVSILWHSAFFTVQLS